MDSIKKMHFILKQLFYTYYKKQMNFQIKAGNTTIVHYNFVVAKPLALINLIDVTV